MLVGDSYEPSLSTGTGRGPYPRFALNLDQYVQLVQKTFRNMFSRFQDEKNPVPKHCTVRLCNQLKGHGMAKTDNKNPLKIPVLGKKRNVLSGQKAYFSG